ncbi:ATP-binding cassette subfamily C protein [Rhodopseudomonas thermotolerans]|uniref:ATP-binding cassette subfamily C protein n=3 Tax=Nitrobacteraceae TaxID=41294 RepID=A0A336JVC4_9BRAD|nr:ATP-binding cassette subfamily C protein [Rhodopseudomonas pentothenatexigens]REF90165.1 ATP-binding cassette subfamily C protein [Rhodopseudomonas thermotolerans]SSW93348.1 ATP-binding cassette subfamily C protein [Rhodopseudomonas pentothenatexigens]
MAIRRSFRLEIMTVPTPSQQAATKPRDLTTVAIASCRNAFIAVGLFSAVINLLMLAGPIYMLQVYDRVIPSRSIPTLIALSIAVAACYALQGLFDSLRQRILTRIGAALHIALWQPVVATILRGPLRGGAGNRGSQLSHDLDSVRSFLSGLGPTTLFDLPWMPLYLAGCFLLHPYLGWTLVAGAVLLFGIALVTELLTREPTREASRSGAARGVQLEAGRRNAEIVAALGMERRLIERIGAANDEHIAAQQRNADIAGSLGALSKTLRFMLQSALLGLGAYLVIEGEASSGVMIAASIMGSRALAPVELAISIWRPFLGARQAWQRLRAALGSGDAPASAVAPEPATQRLTVEQVFVAAPGSGTPIVQNATFKLEAGQALGVIGPSAAGKSTLARALVGIWPVGRGELRLDGATLDQWPADIRGGMIGYLPQDVELFDGTVAENIARFDPEIDDQAVIAAAKAAGAYDMILKLPKGFEMRVGEAGATLSGGQRQRIALARALYKDPFMVVLDEPNASLDAEGDAALTEAIRRVRARGGIAIIVAHRPAALAAVDLVLTLANGQVQAFGPKDEVLRKTLAGHPVPGAVPLQAVPDARMAPAAAVS